METGRDRRQASLAVTRQPFPERGFGDAAMEAMAAAAGVSKATADSRSVGEEALLGRSLARVAAVSSSRSRGTGVGGVEGQRGASPCVLSNSGVSRRRRPGIVGFRRRRCGFPSLPAPSGLADRRGRRGERRECRRGRSGRERLGWRTGGRQPSRPLPCSWCNGIRVQPFRTRATRGGRPWPAAPRWRSIGSRARTRRNETSPLVPADPAIPCRSAPGGRRSTISSVVPVRGGGRPASPRSSPARGWPDLAGGRDFLLYPRPMRAVASAMAAAGRLAETR